MAVTTGSYIGPSVLVTDPANKQRKSISDAQGRLIQVIEDPTNLAYQTNYTYDVLNNLRKVEQGSQFRYFGYDSLSRPIRIRNVEQTVNTALNWTDPVTGYNGGWTTGMSYDNNGNVTTRSDARNVTTTYGYDALNRNTGVSYSDGTPGVGRVYDGAFNGKGRLWYDWDSSPDSQNSHMAIDIYDELGRVKQWRRHFRINGNWSLGYYMSRNYNLAGNVTSQSYPSGRTVNYTYDDAGRTLSFTGNLGDGVTRTYASGITYSAFGGKQQEQFGTQTPLFHKLHYNVRGQLYDVRLSTVSWQSDEWNWDRGALILYYGYPWQQSGPLNNGNVSIQQHWVPANYPTSYNYTEQHNAYDQLNRVTSVAEYYATQSIGGAFSFTQIYDYDRWGNRTINLATTNAPEPQFTASSTTNRLGVAAGYTGRMDYDAAGNLVNDTYTSFGIADGTPTRLYDAENRLTTVKDGTLQVVSSYSYNAEGQRVRRKVNGVETWQVHGIDGELLGEYAAGAASFIATKEYGYRNGELLVTVSSGDDQRMKRFLQALYYGALQVDAPSQWMTDKSAELATAGVYGNLLVKAKEIARALFVQTNYETNPPARSDTQYVTDLYYAYLQRGPDTGGLGFWVPQAAGSVQNRINVLNAFEASGEFQTIVNTLYGTATSDGQRTENYITSFYQGALARPPDSAELSTNSATLNNAAAQGQSQVISAAETMGRNLFAPQVNDAGLSNTQYVTNLYEGFLQRGPDSSGLGFWSGQASVGQGRQNVLNAFAASSAFRELAGTLYREAYWLVADHLGTPRMVVNKSGSLAGVKRHDYLPFGEELGLISGRTPTQGYTGDSVRQKFTGYEADGETGLNFAQARYQSQAQGRFTSVDPLGASANVASPQSFNRYTYVSNNPVNLTDPTGMMQASAGWGSVSNGFWGSSFDFTSSHFGGPGIIGAAQARQDGLVQARIDGMLAVNYLQEGNVEAANAIFDRNSDVGRYVNGEVLWGSAAALAKATVRVAGIELLENWGEDPTTSAAGKGSVAPFDYSDNPSSYILDVNQGGVDPNSIFTVAVTFKGFDTDGWVPDSAKASAPKGGRWRLVETPTGLPPLRTREKGEMLTMLLNVKGDLGGQNKPISVQVSAYYHSLYRQDKRAGIERGSITGRISLKLLIGEVKSSIR